MNSREEGPRPIPYSQSFAFTHRTGLLYAAHSSHFAFTKHLGSNKDESACDEFHDVDAENEDAAPRSQPAHWDPRKEARDAWLYSQLIQGVIYKTVKSQLRELCVANDWDYIDSDSGIKRAASGYAELRDLSPLPKRRHGRPSRQS